MKIIKPSITLETNVTQEDILKHIEKAGRVCYKSEGNIKEDSAAKFVSGILKRGHESVIEHFFLSVRIVCDRGVSHEIVRHRLASYSQESTRYCNYTEGKFGNELTMIRPCYWAEDSAEFLIWETAMSCTEGYYFTLVKRGATPQEAQSVLPNSLKTEIVMTANLREWRHFLKLRTSKAAHPQMREIACMILDEFTKRYPVIFGDINKGDDKG